jgi:hypothetical protein
MEYRKRNADAGTAEYAALRGNLSRRVAQGGVPVRAPRSVVRLGRRRPRHSASVRTRSTVITSPTSVAVMPNT